MTCYLYIILCKNGALYTGITDNPLRRWTEHYAGKGARYVRNNGFDKPVCLIKYPNRSTAMKVENEVKKMPKEEKHKLIDRTKKDLLDWFLDGWKPQKEQN